MKTYQTQTPAQRRRSRILRVIAKILVIELLFVSGMTLLQPTKAAYLRDFENFVYAIKLNCGTSISKDPAVIEARYRKFAKKYQHFKDQLSAEETQKVGTFSANFWHYYGSCYLKKRLKSE